MITYQQNIIENNKNIKIHKAHIQNQAYNPTLQSHKEDRNLEVQADYNIEKQFYRKQDSDYMKQVDYKNIQNNIQSNQTNQNQQLPPKLNCIISEKNFNKQISDNSLKQNIESKDIQNEDNFFKNYEKQNYQQDSYQNIIDKNIQNNADAIFKQQSTNQPNIEQNNFGKTIQMHKQSIDMRNIENQSFIRNQIPNQYEISQKLIDIYDPNTEDLVACQVPESIPIKTQLSSRNLDIDKSKQNQSTINLSTQHQNQQSMNPIRSINNNILQKQDNIQSIDKNDNENDDIYSVDMQSSIPSSYNKTIPTSDYYHPSKRKINCNMFQAGKINAKNQIQSLIQDDKQKIEKQQNDFVLETDEIQQDIDENGNLKISEYQKTNYNNIRQYSQYNQNTFEDIQPISDEQQRNTDFNRPQSTRNPSLFKYDPQMFSSITGYFYPQSQSQQGFTLKFDEEEAMLNLKIAYYNQEEKYNKFENLIKKYLVNQERVFIQKINREISGLQSAENLGDYFIRKVAGCSRAQVFPVYIGVRGDGNCFYRALIVSYLVHLLTKEESLEEFEQLIFDIFDEKHPLIQLEYQGNIRNDSDNVKIILIQQLLLLLIERKQSKEKDEISLFLMKMFDNIANDHDFDYSLVSLCRSMISYSLDQYGTNSVYSEYFLQEDIEITRQKLRAYKEDAEYHTISLSTEIFRFPIQIIQLLKDKNGNFELNESVTYSPLVKQPYQGQIYILLSDEHYDLVFGKEICLDYFPSLSLFKNHQKYKEDLQNLIDDPNTQQNLRHQYQGLMNDYYKFLKEQDVQIYKVRESFANLQTLYQSKVMGRQSSASLHSSDQDSNENELAKDLIIKTQTQYINQQDFVKQDSIVISNKQSQNKNSDQIFSEQKSISQEFIIENQNDKNQNLVQINVKMNTPIQNQFQINNQNNNQNILETPKRDITSNLHNLQLMDQLSEPFSNQKQNQQKSTQENSFLTPCKQINCNTSENYYNIESNRLIKQQSFQSTAQLNNFSNKKNSIKYLQEQKDQFIQCIHTNNEQITIKSIICCKIQYEVCYPCFKTRQIFQCINCKKDILSFQRLNTTCKVVQYHCKKCENTPEIIVLFNKIYCTQCDIQKE